VNQSFTVVTATTSEGTLSEEVTNAAKHAPTAIIFMGLNKLSQIVVKYQVEGRGELPVAVVSRGSRTEGEVIVGTVDTIEELVTKNRPAAPALLVFGEGAKNASQLTTDSWGWSNDGKEVA
ncbi:MAG: hypothetical protein KI790_12545, partial [Cyclobacteriaceae bacterium]|nr:hypothetical protein [Cyclobacteriaceae bacterium HetDA_MAG_MS6]